MYPQWAFLLWPLNLTLETQTKQNGPFWRKKNKMFNKMTSIKHMAVNCILTIAHI